MIPRLLAALAALLSVLTRAHLTLTVIGITFTVSVPWVLSAAFLLVLAGMAWIIWRNVRGFRSSPYVRNRFAT
jgi:ABC-type nickel/cobalt efflux system permease component RcnA